MATKTYQITEDTYINGRFDGYSTNQDGSNYSTSSTLQVNFRRGSSTGNDAYQCALLKFDISELKYKKINSATLYLYKISSNDDPYFGKCRFREQWSASNITGNNVTNNASPTGVSYYESPSVSGNWHGYNLRQLLTNAQDEDRKNGTNRLSYGVGIQQDRLLSDTITSYYSSKGSNKPYVTVQYEDVPPLQPSATSPSGSF
ncbi:DNRLRE domain-containing protein [Clostridium sp. Marseille-Q7071]